MDDQLSLELTNRLPTCRRGEGFADAPEIEDGRIRGRAVPYGVTVELRPGLLETFEPGAFARQLEQRHRVKLCLEHGQVIGAVDTMEERDDGLWFDAHVSASPDIAEARRARALLAEDLVDELSVGFATVKGGSRSERLKDGATTLWTHSRAKLMEISLVPWGVYGRDATLARSRLIDPTSTLLDARRAEVRAWFETWRRSA